MYTPTSATISVGNWPTLGEMIDAGGRVVVMMDAQADFGTVPWLIDGELDACFREGHEKLADGMFCWDNRVQQHVGGCVW